MLIVADAGLLMADSLVPNGLLGGGPTIAGVFSTLGVQIHIDPPLNNADNISAENPTGAREFVEERTETRSEATNGGFGGKVNSCRP